MTEVHPQRVNPRQQGALWVGLQCPDAICPRMASWETDSQVSAGQNCPQRCPVQGGSECTACEPPSHSRGQTPDTWTEELLATLSCPLQPKALRARQATPVQPPALQDLAQWPQMPAAPHSFSETR